MRAGAARPPSGVAMHTGHPAQKQPQNSMPGRASPLREKWAEHMATDQVSQGSSGSAQGLPSTWGAVIPPRWAESRGTGEATARFLLPSPHKLLRKAAPTGHLQDTPQGRDRALRGQHMPPGQGREERREGRSDGH